MLKSATEILSESFRLYAKHWRSYIPYLLIMFLPTLLLSMIGTISLYLSLYSSFADIVSNIIIIIILAIGIVLTILTAIALTKSINASLADQTLDWKENLRASNHIMWPFIWTSILAGLIILGGSILFVIPGIIFAVWYTFATYPVIFDNIKGMEALRVSKSMVVGRWWQIAWKLLVIGFLIFLVGLIPSLLPEIASAIPMAKFLQETLAGVLSSLIGVILTPIYYAAYLIMYLNVKQNPTDSETPLPPPQA